MEWPAKPPVKPEPILKSSRIPNLQAELAIAQAEEEFVVKKLAGQAVRTKALAAAFAKAKSVEAYEAAKLLVPTAVSMEDKLALRALRQDYRLNHRKPVKPSEGAAPDPIKGSIVVREVG